MQRLIRALLMVPALTGPPSSIAAAADSPQRPNVLLIVSEDNGPELSCYGAPYVKTSRLDQLAAEGVRFENAFVPYSVCSPSRACFLTGLYPHQNGQIGLATHKFAMYQEWPNLVSLLKQAGYRTGYLGKIHVNPESAFPIDFRAIPGANFDNRPVRKYADAAARFFTEAEGPWFLSVNYPDAHFPLHRQQHGLPRQPLDGDEVMPLPWVGADSARLREATANYYNCLMRLDAGVGMLLDELQRSEQADQTLVIYLGDHGAQFSRSKGSVYEAGLRIPLIVRYPSVARPGTVCKELASTLDLLPTVLEATGVSAPDNLAGQSLIPLLRGESVSWRTHLFGVTTGSAPALYYPQESVRDERYKLIVSPERKRENATAAAYLNQYNAHFIAGTRQQEIDASPPHVQAAYARYLNPPELELYDLRTDPHEWYNLADDPRYAVIRKELHQALREWQIQTRDPLGDPEMLSELTAAHDRAGAMDYRRDPSFRWDYLETFPRFMNPASPPLPHNPKR
jgi:N-sulfoglucosamine sulfohydrolase